MRSWSRALARVLPGFVLLAGGLVWGYATGPSELVTGAPNEGTCADVTCHTSFPVNSGSGSFSVTALNSTPGQYTPGDTVDLRIDLQQTGQKRWGFQLTVISSAGDPIGTILISEPSRTRVEAGAGGRQYLTHTLVGTDSNTVDASPGWTFRWKTPPAGAGPATFYAAANAADADNTSLGDYVYTLSTTLAEGTASVREPEGTRPDHFALGHNWPNPFNAGTRISYRLGVAAVGPVTVSVHDLAGRSIRTLIESRFRSAGEHWIHWDGRDEEGRPAPSGTYFVTLSTRAGSEARKVLLLR